MHTSQGLSFRQHRVHVKILNTSKLFQLILMQNSRGLNLVVLWHRSNLFKFLCHYEYSWVIEIYKLPAPPPADFDSFAYGTAMYNI